MEAGDIEALLALARLQQEDRDGSLLNMSGDRETTAAEQRNSAGFEEVTDEFGTPILGRALERDTRWYIL
jgi:hypothetical protein